MYFQRMYMYSRLSDKGTQIEPGASIENINQFKIFRGFRIKISSLSLSFFPSSAIARGGISRRSVETYRRRF